MAMYRETAPGSRSPYSSGARTATRSNSRPLVSAGRTAASEHRPLGVREFLCLVDDDVRERSGEPIGGRFGQGALVQGQFGHPAERELLHQALAVVVSGHQLIDHLGHHPLLRVGGRAPFPQATLMAPVAQ